MKDIGKDMLTAEVHLYADDTIVYSAVYSLSQAVGELLTAFQQLQASLHGLMLRLKLRKPNS